MAKKKNSQTKALKKELGAYRKHRKELEKKIEFMKGIEKEKKKLHEAETWQRRQKVAKLKKGLEKAFFITGQTGKKVRKFMKEDHL